MSRLTPDGIAEPVSRDQILRRERGQGNFYFPCSADHEQDWQPYTRLIHTLAICVTIHTYINIHILDTRHTYVHAMTEYTASIQTFLHKKSVSTIAPPKTVDCMMNEPENKEYSPLLQAAKMKTKMRDRLVFTITSTCTGWTSAIKKNEGEKARNRFRNRRWHGGELSFKHSRQAHSYTHKLIIHI